MPSWKKVIVSGSDAALNSLNVTNGVTGSLFGTASYATSASQALTASYSKNLQISGSINNVDYIDFSTNYVIGTNSPAQKEGRIFYDSGSGALAVYNWEQDVTLNVGQESWLRARNQTGVTITNGSVVKLVGAIGDRPTIALAQSTDQTNTFSNDNEIIGMATHDIETGTDGFVTTFGTVNGLNTAAFTAGDILWVSQSAGQFTKTAPSAPFDKTFVGIVTRANVSNGSVFVTPLTPIHFHDISSVSASVYQQGDLWMYRSGSAGLANAWINTKQLSGSYGLTGSLNVTGNGITGSLFGTSSYATSASQAISSSFAINASSSLRATNATQATNAQRTTQHDTTGAGNYYIMMNDTSVGGDGRSYNTSNLGIPLYYNATSQYLYGKLWVGDVSGSLVGNVSGNVFGNATTATNATSASYANVASSSLFAVSSSRAVSASNALTASFVTTLNQAVLITGSATIGATTAGANENTLTLGARDTANEGGQLGLNAPGGTYTSASFIDNWQNNIRILRGNNTTSDATVVNWNLHTKQMQLPQYTNASSFVGTATANLAVDSSGNIITVSTSGASVFPYTGNAVITGSLTTTGIIYAQPNGGMYFQGGDDAALYDINVVNTMGIYGVQDSTVGAIKLGSAGATLYSSGSKFGINTTAPTSASLTVNGNIWATSLTGSLLGTASYATNSDQLDGLHATSFVLNSQTSSMTVTSASFAANASSSLRALTANSASYATIASSSLFATNANDSNTLQGNAANKFVLNDQTSSMTVLSASFAANASSSLRAISSSFATLAATATTASYATTAQSVLGTITNASTASNITPAITNTANNRVLTDNGGGTINGESNLTFDGTTLGITGSLNQGISNSATNFSHAQGNLSIASGRYSHAEGDSSVAIASGSHAEGGNTFAGGDYSHAEGNQTSASATYAHSEGWRTQALNLAAHSEGQYATASGASAHAEGDTTIAIGQASHAEGSYTVAIGNASHAAGYYTSASGNYQSVIGQYNIPIATNSTFIIGNGTAEGARSNLLYASGSQVQITGSLVVTGGITGSFSGTTTSASYANIASSSLFATTAGTATSATSATSASYANIASSSLFATNAQNVLGTVTTALSASKIAINNTPTTAGTFYPVFVSEIEGFGAARVDNSTLTYDTTTNTLSTSTFSGALTGTATSASMAVTVGINNNPSSGGGPFYVPFVASAAGNATIQVDNSTFIYAPSTNTLTVDNLAGTASYATTSSRALIANSATSATSASYATVASSSLFATTAGTANSATSATSASYATVASSSLFASNAASSSVATTSSFANYAAASFTALSASQTFSSSFASYTNNVLVTDTTSGTGPYYIMFADGTTGNRIPRVDSSTLTFNATTNTITVTNLTGTASFATTASHALGAVSSGIIQQGGKSYVTHDFNSYPNVYDTTFINPLGSTNLPTNMSSVMSYRFIMGGGDTTARGVDLVVAAESSGNMYMRERSIGTWSRMLHSNNFNSYSPTLTGTGASGTWGIGISGNAATATSASYATIASSSLFATTAGTATSATSAGSVTNAVTFNNGGAGDASGTTFNGSAARTISYNSIGAPSTGGTGATGTWGIGISGNAATATSASMASAVAITNQDTTPVTYNLTFVGATSGNQTLSTDSTALLYTPSSGIFETPIVNSSTGVRGGNGSASTPAFSFSGDTNTGMYNITADTLGFATNGGERVRITAAGAMGLGITPTNTSGRFEASNDIVAYSTSDKRWKNNIVKIDSPLEKISQISGVEFDWIEDEPFHGNKGHDVGVIAQEIELIIPEAVQTRESGMKAVQYDKIIPLLIESIKEQQKQIDELKELVNKLTK